MKQVVQYIGSGKLELADVPEPACKTGGIVVRNAASLISAGTEKMVIDFAGKSLLGKAQQRPDLVKKVLEKARKEGVGSMVRAVTAGLSQSMALGYSCAGVVEAVGRGAEEFSVGQRVACAGMGYASHADVVFVPKNLAVTIPDSVSFEDASYVTLGAIALQGVRVAEPTMGEIIAVIGLGLLGQLTVALLKAAGCRVIAIDLDPAKVAAAKTLGADFAVARADDVLGTVAEATENVGADAVIVAAATDSNDPIELAGDITRERGRISMVGAVRMDVPRKAYYMKELELRLSRSYGPGRYDPAYEEGGHDYPVGYVRWTERRNMQEFLRLISSGAVKPGMLTSHRFPISRATEAYDIVAGRTGVPYSGIVLQYDAPIAKTPPLRTIGLGGAHVRNRGPRVVGTAFIGAGNFASAVLLPRFARRSNVSLEGIATARGINSATAGKKFGFRYATTDIAQILNDANVKAVVIATRHGSHAALATDGLRAGKAVFVEKPLAIDEEMLKGVVAAQQATGGVLAVGFNRRFSPLAQGMKAAFRPGTQLAMEYRINAGRIPRESWVHDPIDGGGRIIGEGCHFVDFLQFVSGETPVEVFAYALGGADGALHDTVTISLKFSAGSIGTIIYLATGDTSLSKERIEVFGGGTVASIDDFRELRITNGGRTTKRRLSAQDKGFDGEIDAFLRSTTYGDDLPISISSLVATTRATFAIEQSLRTGTPVAVES